MNHVRLPIVLFGLITSLSVGLLIFSKSIHQVYSTANHLEISQIQIAGTSLSDEFVELYNPTDIAVSLANWKLKRKAASGTEYTLIANLTGSIPAFGYFLAAQTGYDGLVIPDITYTSSIGSDNTILLYNPNDTIPIDKVGMGIAVDYETKASINPAAGNSIQRINLFDSDNNFTDFVELSPGNPHNSLSPTVTPTLTATPEPTPTSTPLPTPTNIPEPTPSPTVTPSPTPSPTLTPTPTPTVTPSSTPSVTPTPTQTPIPTSTPTVTPSQIPSPSPTSTPIAIPSVTPTNYVIPHFNHHFPEWIFFRYPFICHMLPQQFKYFGKTIYIPVLKCSMTPKIYEKNHH